LIQAGRESEARRILEDVSGAEQAEEEIRAVREVLGQEEGRFGELFGRRFRTPLMVAVALMAFSQFSGINAIMYYSTKIFTTAGIGVKDAFGSSVIVGRVSVLFTFVAIGLVDRAGRRLLLLIGLAVQVVALGTVGAMFMAGVGGVFLLVAILAFIAAFAMALGPIPWIVCSEVFPTRIRGRAMSVATFTIWVSCYVVAQTFPVLNDHPSIGPAKTFLVYAAFSLGAWVFVLRALPETRRRTLEEIEASWGR
jgi:SP family arabinose:H+ symporter-like MFS transporter